MIKKERCDYMQTLGKNIGKTIIKLREEKNLSAKDLAGMVRKSQSYISKLETGNVKNPRKETLTDILKGMEVEPKRINEIISSFYGEEVSDIEKVDNVLLVKQEEKVVEDEVEKVESNTDFIQNNDLQFSAQTSQKEPIEKVENEQIIFQFSNRHDLGFELNTIGHELNELGRVLVNRKILDTRYDSVKYGINRLSDRLEIFKVNYDLYIEKLIREGNKVNS
jgi:transcriptional regulator with XRE-family HTH domain